MPRIGDDLKARKTLIERVTEDKPLGDITVTKQKIFDFLKQYPGAGLNEIADGIDASDRTQVADALRAMVVDDVLSREQRGYIINATRPKQPTSFATVEPVLTRAARSQQYSPAPTPATVTPTKYSLPRRQDRVEARSKALQARRLLRTAKTLLDYCEAIAYARKMHPEDRDVWTVEQILGWGMPVRQTTAAVRSSSRTPSVRSTSPTLSVSARLSARHGDAVKTHIGLLLQDLQSNPGAYSINEVITRLNRALYG